MKIFPAVASLLTLMVFTRLMTPSNFGVYSLTVNIASTAVAILANFLIIGLGRLQPAAVDYKQQSELHSTVMLSSFGISLMLIISISILSYFNILPQLSINYLYAVLIFIVSTYLSLSQKLINANLKPFNYGISHSLKNLLVLILGYTFLRLGFGVELVLASIVIASLIATLPAINSWAQISIKGFSLKILKELWNYGAPLTLLYVFVMVIAFSDRIFIDLMLNSSQLGLYSATYDLTQYTIGVIGTVLHLATFPIIIKAYENEGVEKTKEILKISLRILIFSLVPLTFGMIVLKNNFSMIFLGSAFIESSSSLIPILAISTALSAIKSYYYDYSFQLVKNTLRQTIPPLLAALVNCFLNFILIPKYGINGAAYATLISYISYLIVCIYLANKTFPLPTFPYVFFGKVVISSSIMGYLVSLIDFDITLLTNTLIQIVLGIVIYMFCAYIFLRKELTTIYQDAQEVS